MLKGADAGLFVLITRVNHWIKKAEINCALWIVSFQKMSGDCDAFCVGFISFALMKFG